MSTCQYLELEFLEDKEELPLPGPVRLLPGRLKQKARAQYIEKRLPLLERETELFGKSGTAVKLPYLKKEFMGLLQEGQVTIIRKVLEEYPRVPVGAPPCIERLLLADRAPRGISLMLSFMELIFIQLLREQKISRKEMKLVCMERPDMDILGLLEAWQPDLNFLTVVTDNPERYEEFAENASAKTGLLVSVLKRPLRERLCGNVILDFGGGEEKESLFYPKNASVVDLSGEPARMRSIIARRKDIRYYNRLYLKLDGRELDAGLVEAALGVSGTLSADASRALLGTLSRYGAAFERVGVKRFL